MKKLFSGMVLGVALLVLLGTTIGTSDKGSTSVGTGTYVDSQTDTVKWTRENGVSALAFAALYNDTVEVTTARVLRVVHGKPITQGAALEGDTLTRLTALDQTTTANIALGISTSDAITMAPLADAYWVIVQYAASGNAVTTGTVRYEFIKQYGK